MPKVHISFLIRRSASLRDTGIGSLIGLLFKYDFIVLGLLRAVLVLS